MKNKYLKAVQFLESLQIMPKTMPGLQKIKNALAQTDWYAKINPEKIIVVAGTNGKGSTCAMLEALLIDARQRVGFYSSPHLVSTTERIRLNGLNMTEEDFVKVFEECEPLIRSCSLSHFEALTFMAGHYYFSNAWGLNTDYVIFEVGLGGTFDATNAFPHRFSVITPLGIDHANILGHTLVEIAQNKFGIIQDQSIVIHHKFSDEIQNLLQQTLLRTHSQGVVVDFAQMRIEKSNEFPKYILESSWGLAPLSLLGKRAGENASTALKTFAALGFDPALHLKALADVKWAGRMQKLDWPGAGCPVYLSGDHNPHGIDSLLEILKDFSWKTLHVVIGLGSDKEAKDIFQKLFSLQSLKIYLTVTPFKGRYLDQYPDDVIKDSEFKSENPIVALQKAAEMANPGDLILVTGSLYLVGEILKYHQES